jgi:hypothetical protein
MESEQCKGLKRSPGGDFVVDLVLYKPGAIMRMLGFRERYGVYISQGGSDKKIRVRLPKPVNDARFGDFEENSFSIRGTWGSGEVFLEYTYAGKLLEL